MIPRPTLPFYTQTHFEISARCDTVALAMFVGLCAVLSGRKSVRLAKGALFALSLLLSGRVWVWMPLCMLCLAAILRELKRACPRMVLFATAGGCCYPVTLCAAGSGLCVCDLRGGAVHVAGVIPGAKREVSDHAG
ncbi:MAG: hypothetical protein ACLVJB_03485 [Christensenellales bacterium]